MSPATLCGVLAGLKRDRDHRLALDSTPLESGIYPAAAESPPKVVLVPLVGAVRPDA